jgi:hypothetical protein
MDDKFLGNVIGAAFALEILHEMHHHKKGKGLFD